MSLKTFNDFYQFLSPTRTVVGTGLLESIGFEFAKEGAGRVLIVTDEVIRSTGLIDKVESGLVDGGLEVVGVYDAVPPDSETAIVSQVAELAKERGADSFVAVGGGSVMDTAKIANVVFTHGGAARDWEGYYGLPRANDGAGRPLELAPLACVPTTAGTGSEANNTAVIKDSAAKVKFLIGDFPIYPRLAVLDPETTRTLPPKGAAATGIDALTHAIEGLVSTQANPHSDAYALQALRLIRENLRQAVLHPEDDAARGNMLIAANLAIQPTSSSAIGISHSLSHACGAHFNVVHGVANAINLPGVIEYNCAGDSETADRYRTAAEFLGLSSEGSDSEVGARLADYVRSLVVEFGLPTRLSEVGIPDDSEVLARLAEDALGDGCTFVNPRQPTLEDLIELYRKAL